MLKFLFRIIEQFQVFKKNCMNLFSHTAQILENLLK